jgi:hypothetical protein
MMFANAINLDRKSGAAQGRDLQFTSMGKRNSEVFVHDTFAVPESETAVPSPALRYSRDDKFEGSGQPWQSWRRDGQVGSDDDR